MTARARLRAIADRVQGFGVEAGKDAAALRAIADRIDHEMRWAQDIERASQEDPRTKHQAIIVQGCLSRLDADLTTGPTGREGR